MPHKPDILTTYCKDMFQKVIAKLPPDLGARLKCNSKVSNHGSYRTVHLFDVWDRDQSDVLPRKHFKYCLGYDPLKLISGGTTWYFHLWINTVRLYRDRLAVKATLEKKLRAVTPKPFKFNVLDRAVEAKINFEEATSLAETFENLVPRYVDLITAFHPLLIPIIDRFSIYGRGDVKKS